MECGVEWFRQRFVLPWDSWRTRIDGDGGNSSYYLDIRMRSSRVHPRLRETFSYSLLLLINERMNTDQYNLQNDHLWEISR